MIKLSNRSVIPLFRILEGIRRQALAVKLVSIYSAVFIRTHVSGNAYPAVTIHP